MTLTTTLKEPSGWRIVAAHGVSMAGGVVVSVGSRFVFPDAPVWLFVLLTVLTTVALGLLLMHHFYSKPYKAYREEKNRLYEEEQARAQAKREARDSRNEERMRELEAEEVLFGAALQIKKPRKS